VTIDPSDSLQVVSNGTRLFLYCEAEGYPVPTIQWFSNDTLIAQQPSLLYRVPTEFSHTTKYTCVGTNNAGNMKNTAKFSVTVMVEGKLYAIYYTIV